MLPRKDDNAESVELFADAELLQQKVACGCGVAVE